MRAIAILPCAAVLTLAVLGCSQHASTAASTAPAATRPQSSGETNMFGDNKDDAAGNAQRARAATFGSDHDTTQQADAAQSGNPPPSHR